MDQEYIKHWCRDFVVANGAAPPRLATSLVPLICILDNTTRAFPYASLRHFLNHYPSFLAIVTFVVITFFARLVTPCPPLDIPSFCAFSDITDTSCGPRITPTSNIGRDCVTTHGQSIDLTCCSATGSVLYERPLLSAS